MFRPEKEFDGKRLVNHVIRIVEVTVREFCETMCYIEPDCVSINLHKRAGGRGVYRCELNNVTHEGHEDELTNNASYFIMQLRYVLVLIRFVLHQNILAQHSISAPRFPSDFCLIMTQWCFLISIAKLLKCGLVCWSVLFICICFFYHNVNMFASLKKKCLGSYQ